ncbi:DNA repair protein RecN [Camelliibacillus cellulosilyticus]|uniref:DNA repair protein RecN n=1 Tax=Camelliibacillus cellulosilyticus TaxID=2174486 RepID=A0ABV9GI17_9BACL
MLRELRIENFAIIEKSTISFEEGLTVITGETGAGKSMIIDAITLLIGGRGSAEFVRHGTEKAEIEALFDIGANASCQAELSDLGIETDEGMLVLRRQINSNGKSVCRANGRLITLSNLRAIGQHLIDIHSQNEHQELLLPEKHIRLLDRFGGAPLQNALEDYREIYNKISKVHEQIERLSKNEQQMAQRLDLLTYQIQEIEAANLSEQEEALLLDERRKLANFEKIFAAVRTGYEALNGDGKGLDCLRQAVAAMDNVKHLDNELNQMAEAVGSSLYILEEQGHYLRDYMERFAYDPERLNTIEARLDELSRLKRKYGQTIGEVLQYLAVIRKEYMEISERDQTIDTLNKKYHDLFTELVKKADKLTGIRAKTGALLAKAINAELKDLYMDKARFDVGVETRGSEELHAFHANGRDRIEFFISTNAGEPFKPLARIASGGEMSRIMLAIKSHFKTFSGMTSIIFDEVDTGVSGRVAQAMAEKIAKLSQSSQVFCITHLPQVAAMADQHLYISKVEKANRTVTRVQALTDEEKVAEIARMISGVEMTELTKRHAEELLTLAQEVKL